MEQESDTVLYREIEALEARNRQLVAVPESRPRLPSPFLPALIQFPRDYEEWDKKARQALAALAQEG